MVLLVYQLEGEPFIKLAEDAHEGNVNQTWQVDPIAVFVAYFDFFKSGKLVIEPLNQRLRPNNGKYAEAAQRKS